MGVSFPLGESKAEEASLEVELFIPGDLVDSREAGKGVVSRSIRRGQYHTVAASPRYYHWSG